MVLTASGDLVGKIDSDADGAGVDLMPGLDERPFPWTMGHGEVYHDEATGSLPIGSSPQNSLVNFEVTVWIPWAEPGSDAEADATPASREPAESPPVA